MSSPSNAIVNQFAHLLPPSGRYPQRHVTIVWNADPAITELEVVFIPRTDAPDEAENELWAEFCGYLDDWDCHQGNASGDWLKHAAWTPAAVFGRLMSQGFATRQAMINAIAEFAEIEEARWAREMMLAFRATPYANPVDLPAAI